jgi:hypothetical protein
MEGTPPQKFPHLELIGVLALSAFVTSGIFLFWSRVELNRQQEEHQKENSKIEEELRMLKEHLNISEDEVKKR